MQQKHSSPSFLHALISAPRLIVSLAAAMCHVAQREEEPWEGALRDETQSGCEGDNTFDESLFHVQNSGGWKEPVSKTENFALHFKKVKVTHLAIGNPISYLYLLISRLFAKVQNLYSVRFMLSSFWL